MDLQGLFLKLTAKNVELGLSLKDVDLGAGVVYMAASRDTEVAWEDSKLAHGVFTHHFLASLSRPDDQPAITIASLYDAIYSGVRTFSRDRQHPVLSGNFAGAALPSLRHRKD